MKKSGNLLASHLKRASLHKNVVIQNHQQAWQPAICCMFTTPVRKTDLVVQVWSTLKIIPVKLSRLPAVVCNQIEKKNKPVFMYIFMHLWITTWQTCKRVMNSVESVKVKKRQNFRSKQHSQPKNNNVSSFVYQVHHH